MSDEAPTKPMLETILKEMRDGFTSMNERFVKIDERFTAMDKRFTGIETRLTAVETRLSSVEGRLHVIETQLFNMDIRFDRLESVSYGAHSQLVNLRADFKEFRAQFKAPA